MILTGYRFPPKIELFNSTSRLSSKIQYKVDVFLNNSIYNLLFNIIYNMYVFFNYILLVFIIITLYT